MVGIEFDDVPFLTSFQEGLDGDRGRDRLQWCHLLTSFQEGPHQKLLFQGKKLCFKIL